MIGCLMVAVSSRAAVIASDDFSDGTIGNELDGVAVQSGSGTWTKSYSDGYTGSLNPALVFSAGGVGVPATKTGASAAIINEYSAYTNMQLSTVFYVGSSKDNAPQITLGFYETINKGYLSNIVDDDIVSYRFITSGPNAGKIQWKIYDEGVSKLSSYNGDVVTFASNDLVRLTLSYNQQTGEVVTEAYNITQDAVINAGTNTVLGIGGLNYAGIQVLSLVADAADPFYFKSVQLDGGARPLDGIIASDDFTDGTIGEPIVGHVQSGLGNWTDTTSLSPLLLYGIAGAMATTNSANASMAILDDYTAHTNKLSVSTVFSVGDNKFDNPNVYIGFLETIDAGIAQNVTTDDILGVRMLTDGANEGKFIWNIRDEGAVVENGYAGDKVTFDSNDVIRLTLTCDFPAGEVTAESYNLTQDSLINSESVTFTNDISGFNYAVANFIKANPTGLANPAYFQSFEIMADSGRFTIPVLMISGAAASAIDLSASNLTLSSGWTNYLQVTENLADTNGWANLYTVTGTAETNWTISADSAAKFFRIQTSQ
jgi:hypothetical protein